MFKKGRYAESQRGYKPEARINEEIRVPEVRLVGPEGEALGIVPIQEALKKTEEYDLDLVEVAPQATPPVCRIMNFSKYKYELDKRERESRKHQKTAILKEVRFRPHIDDHDYAVKLGHAREFLEKGYKVRLRLQFRGREMIHKEQGRAVIERAIKELEGVAKVDKPPQEMGRMILVILMPQKS